MGRPGSDARHHPRISDHTIPVPLSDVDTCVYRARKLARKIRREI